MVDHTGGRRGPSPGIRVYLMDEEPLLRRGLTELISGHPGVEVCGQAQDGAAALQEIPALQPDVAIVDLHLRRDDGFELIRQLRAICPGLKILVLSMHTEAAFARAALQAGADGSIARSKATESMIKAILAVAAGKSFFMPPISGKTPGARPPLPGTP